jgi:hypothetical protein
MRAAAPIDAATPLQRFIDSRFDADAKGPGRFSAAAAMMKAAAARTSGLSKQLRELDIKAPGNDPLADDLQTVTQLFKAGVTSSAVLTVRPTGDNAPTVDTHAPDQAKASEAIIGGIATQVAAIFAAFKNTPYDTNRSMLDMTTVVCASEFMRTMRQSGLPIDATGTDHNSLSNSILIGGKGIRTGLVIGESDSRTADEAISAAHQAFDTEHLKVMGKPFDAATLRTSDDKPDVYRAGDYLSFAMVANTVFELFDVDKSHYWLTERNGQVARTMSKLLS